MLETFGEIDLFGSIKSGIEMLLPELVQGMVVYPHTDHVKINFIPKPGIPMEAILDPPSGENKQQFERELYKLGAEALMQGLEEMVIMRKVREVVEKVETKFADRFSVFCNYVFDRLVDLMKAAAKKIKPGLTDKIETEMERFRIWGKDKLAISLSLLGGGYKFVKKYAAMITMVLFYIPYQVFFRLPGKLFFWLLTRTYHKEFEAPYHEGVLLNVIEKLMDITKDEYDAQQAAAAPPSRVSAAVPSAAS